MSGADYNIHTIDFLNNPSLAGLTEEHKDMGVVQASKGQFESRCTLLVEHDYALMLLQARANLDGDIRASPRAIRWLRLGWPEEWTAGNLDPTWLPVYPEGTQA